MPVKKSLYLTVLKKLCVKKRHNNILFNTNEFACIQIRWIKTLVDPHWGYTMTEGSLFYTFKEDKEVMDFVWSESLPSAFIQQHPAAVSVSLFNSSFTPSASVMRRELDDRCHKLLINKPLHQLFLCSLHMLLSDYDCRHLIEWMWSVT